MTAESSNQINSFKPFVEPFSRLYSEGHLRLSSITALYLETKAKSPGEKSCAALKKVLACCIQAKEAYYSSKTIFGTIAKIYHDFLTSIGIETSLAKAYKALAETDKPSAPKPAEVKVVAQVGPLELSDSSDEYSSDSSSNSSSQSSGSGSAQSAGEKKESNVDFKVQMMLAHYYAMSKKEISVFPIGGTKDQPEKIMMANPDGDVYVLPLRKKQGSNFVDIMPIQNEGARLIYKGELHKLGKEKPEEIAMWKTIGLAAEAKRIASEAPASFDFNDMDMLWGESGGRVILPDISEGDVSNFPIPKTKLLTRGDIEFSGDEDALSEDSDEVTEIFDRPSSPSHQFEDNDYLPPQLVDAEIIDDVDVSQ